MQRRAGARLRKLGSPSAAKGEGRRPVYRFLSRFFLDLPIIALLFFKT